MKKTDAVKHFGNSSRLARALGISRQAVDEWPELVPIRRAIELAERTKHKRNRLRFDPLAYVREPVDGRKSVR